MLQNLIVQFASRYPITRSLVHTLQNACKSLPGGDVRRSVEACLARLSTNQKLAEAMAPLQSLKYPVLERFARLLAGVQDTNQDIFIKTLEILPRGSGSEDGTTQSGAAVSDPDSGHHANSPGRCGMAAMTVAAVLPNWRLYFTGNEKNWLLFVGMIITAVLGSLYVEAELRQMEA